MYISIQHNDIALQLLAAYPDLRGDGVNFFLCVVFDVFGPLFDRCLHDLHSLVVETHLMIELKHENNIKTRLRNSNDSCFWCEY